MIDTWMYNLGISEDQGRFTRCAPPSPSPCSAKAEALADIAHTFNRGRSKQDGSEFAIIPSSDKPDEVAHWANRLGCTCEGNRRRGICTHQVAMQIVDQRANTAMLAAATARTASVFDAMGDDGSEALDRAIARQRAA